MAVTLSQICAQAWRECGLLIDIKATGGSTTTVVDANSRFTSDNALINGTAIVIRDAGGASAAPEGEMQRISDYVASTTTFTVDTAFSAAPATGDSVGLAKPSIPMTQMIQAVNDGLRDLGWIDTLDSTLTYDTSVTQYALPVGLKTSDLVDVLIQTDSTTNDWTSIKGSARIEEAAAGSTGLLYLRNVQFGYDGATMKVIYAGYHPTLAIFSDKVAECIPRSLAVSAAIDKALTWLTSKRADSALGTALERRWSLAKQELTMKKIESPKYTMRHKPRYFIAGIS